LVKAPVGRSEAGFVLSARVNGMIFKSVKPPGGCFLANRLNWAAARMLSDQAAATYFLLKT
jgi:hypothetical protein